MKRFLLHITIGLTALVASAETEGSYSDSITDPEEQYYYGLEFLGYPEDESHLEGIAWIEKSAKQNFMPAQFIMGEHCYSAENYDSAYYWYEQAAAQGHWGAMVYIAYMHAKGTGRPVNFELARQWGQKAYDAGCTFIKQHIKFWDDRIYFETHIDSLISAGNGGDAHALTELGEYYSTFTDDTEQALFYYHKAAEMNDAEALFHIAMTEYFYNGKYEQSVKLLEQAAAQGHGMALYNLGVFYDEGIPVERDREKWIEYTLQAAEKNIPSALYNLGLHYYYGDMDITQDYTKAVDYFARASELGHYNAAKMLAQCYLNGHGVEQNGEMAIQCYLKSFENGNYKVLNEIGDMYLNGNAVEVDYDAAYDWYYKQWLTTGDTNGMEVAESRKRESLRITDIIQDTTKIDDPDIPWKTDTPDPNRVAAYRTLASCYLNGIGVEKNPEEGFRILEHLVTVLGGDVLGISQSNLAECYKNGWGVEQDYLKAAKLYREAFYIKEAEDCEFFYSLTSTFQDNLTKAATGDHTAEYDVALSYYNGCGTEYNPFLGYEYVYRAAMGGNEDAQMSLLRYYNRNDSLTGPKIGFLRQRFSME